MKLQAFGFEATSKLDMYIQQAISFLISSENSRLEMFLHYHIKIETSDENDKDGAHELYKDTLCSN